MIIQRARVIRFLRYLGIFCAITMGFFSIVGSDEDDVKDALNLTFDEDFELEAASVNVTKSAEPTAAGLIFGCEFSYTVQDAIDALDDPNIPDVDIESITLNSATARYRNATWTPASLAKSLTCYFLIREVEPLAGDTAQTTVLANITVDQANSDWADLALTQENIDVINWYLDRPNEEFDVCAVCDDDVGNIETYSVDVDLNLDVTIEGEL